jgi:hypothetical protein
MTDQTISDPIDAPQQAAAPWPLGVTGFGSLGQTAMRALLGAAPYAMAGVARGGQDPGGVPGAIANAATANFSGPLASTTARDLVLNQLIRPIGGKGAADAVSSLIGPMDDPVRRAAQKSMEGNQTVSPLARILAGMW